MGGVTQVTMSSVATTKSLDHLVLTVQDLSATINFYQEVMGMKAESFAPANSSGTKRHALKFGSQKINLHVHGSEFEPKAQLCHIPHCGFCSRSTLNSSTDRSTGQCRLVLSCRGVGGPCPRPFETERC